MSYELWTMGSIVHCSLLSSLLIAHCSFFQPMSKGPSAIRGSWLHRPRQSAIGNPSSLPEKTFQFPRNRQRRITKTSMKPKIAHGYATDSKRYQTSLDGRGRLVD